MKIHPHWKLFALGLQVSGWNHGEWVSALVKMYGEKDPFSLAQSQMLLSAENILQYEYWQEKWSQFWETGSPVAWKEASERWSDWATKNTWFWVVPWEEGYPVSFHDESDFPLVVWSSAELGVRKDQMRIAVVGSRDASAYGMFACASLVKDLVVAHHCAIVSGCARGIDMSAHKQAIRSQGYTYGFVACGASFIPSWQREVFASQCLVSIFPPNVRAQKWHFSQRNIYISRFSKGVLVIEAEEKSGTLLTAHSALEQGRPLAVITHPIFAPNWHGVRSLIHMGAEIVSNAGECMEVFSPQGSRAERRDSLRAEVLSQAQTESESQFLLFLLEQGGSAFEQNFQSIFSQKKVISSLVERGVVVRQAGVVLLSCMIQS